jgi:hypothetical protein
MHDTTTLVEMRQDSRKRGVSDSRTYTLEFWMLMIELGETFGWKQIGATYVATPIKKSKDPEFLKHDYVPGVWRDAKRVEAKDAARWADALGAARASPHLYNMTKARRRSMGQPNGDVDIRNRRLDAAFLKAMDDFIGRLHEGAFSFAAEGASAESTASSLK